MSPAHGCCVLVVDDDPSLAATLKEMLTRDGYAVEVAHSAAEALEIHAANPRIGLALVDLILPGAGGLALTDELRRRDSEIVVVIMTGYGTIETAVEAIKRGAEDYITKPFDYATVRKKVGRLLEMIELRERVAQLETRLERHPCFENIVSVSPAMERLLDRGRLAAAADAPVLILGETGTGKEMMARAIHDASPRARKPFVALNCGALPRELVESELFGFRRGAFTGAIADTPGLFAAASGGTIFLDEIGEMPKDVQVKLLRVLQEGEVRPVGGAKSVHVDVRVLAATNRALQELRGNLLREDLYFRIATIVLQIPPLRSRPEDILVLAQHFAVRVSRRYGRQVNLTRPALETLVGYSFPGNVRELENLIESVTAVSADDPQNISDKDLKPLLQEEAARNTFESAPVSMEQMERQTIERALRLSEGNRTKAASMLGISRDTLYRKMRQYQV
ncbi:MAG: sigma-54-dependent Fis family transcriptional regulator [Candidatus Solibacter usitatus]|nr:sigma-54-dependent Fis family transcriptional regulator [Candidatus Solibacter usitatus]